MGKYAQLAPLDQSERADICMMACHFFSPLNNRAIRTELDLPVIPNQDVSMSLIDFLKWAKLKNVDLWPKLAGVQELMLLLEQRGILQGGGLNILLTSRRYFFMYQLSTLASKGRLWLGKALGPEYIGHEIKRDLVLITGTTPEGDRAIGTGYLIVPGVAITCAHVLHDMKIDNQVVISGNHHVVEDFHISDKADVGVVFLKEMIAPALPDIALRQSRILEEVVIAGFPPIPRRLSPVATLNRGEICGRVEETMDGSPLELFSAIARPGNSGGPVVGLDGRILGIVARSLERPREKIDSMPPFPFFSAVPAEIIAEEFKLLTNGVEIPWESYQ